MKKVLLVDGSNIAYRNHYAQNLATSTGVPTGLIYGTVNSLLFLTREVNPDIVHVVWDPPGGSLFRKALYKLYKANREAMSAEFYESMGLVKQLLGALGVSQITKPGVESDDVLGYLATEYYKDHDVFVASNDKDILSIMSPSVHIMHPEHGLIQLDPLGRISIKEQGKVIWLKPEQVPDYKALVGDTSDNYPGLSGFGIGAAINYFANNHSIDAIMDNTADLRNQRSQALNAIMGGRGILPLFKQLATINMEEGKIEPTPKPKRDVEMVNTLFEHLEFNQFKAFGEAMYRVGGRE